MERKSVIGRLFLVLLFLLLTVQSVIFLGRNRALVRRVFESAAKKVVIEGGKLLDEDGNVISIVRSTSAEGVSSAGKAGASHDIETDGTSHQIRRKRRNQMKARP